MLLQNIKKMTTNKTSKILFLAINLLLNIFYILPNGFPLYFVSK